MSFDLYLGHMEKGDGIEFGRYRTDLLIDFLKKYQAIEPNEYNQYIIIQGGGDTITLNASDFEPSQ